MPKFAVYYVPEEADDLYRLGSSVVGYDVRKREPVETRADLVPIPRFTDRWVAKARPYGFHLTIGDSIGFSVDRIDEIEREIADILGCFNPGHDFTLKKRQEDFVTFWGRAVVLRYDANDYLKILHAVIAARVHPLGTGSGYLQRHLAHPLKESSRHRVNRIREFYSPTIFDSYAPHFTLLDPYSGKNKDELTRVFSRTFARFDRIVLRSICLLVRFDDEENWRIHREFAF
jgi:hypothetical protein